MRILRNLPLLVFSLLLGLGAAASVPTGGDAPVLELGKWFCGKPFTLADSRKAGKLTALLFWNASMPGAAALRSFGAAAHALKGTPVKFLAVSCEDEAKTAGVLGKSVPNFAVAVGSAKTAEQFLRPQDRIPAAAVIDRQGRIIWRGGAGAVAAVCKAELAGKFDLKENVRKEQVSLEMDEKMRAKDYSGVVKLADQELEKDPGNAELVALKCAILSRRMKQPEQALAVAERELNAHPQEPALYDVTVNLCRSLKNWSALERCYDLMLKNCGANGAMIGRYCTYEMSQPMEKMQVKCVAKLAKALAAVPETDEIEKARHQLDASRAMYVCGRPDLALAAAKRALPALKGRQEQEVARNYVRFYTELLALAKTLE